MAWKEGAVLCFVFWVLMTSGGGLIMGFPALQDKMNKEIAPRGQFWQLCHETSQGRDCKHRDDFYANVFNYAAITNAFAQTFFGFIMDRQGAFCGPKVVCVLGLAMLSLGNYLIATIDSDTLSLDDNKARLKAGACLIAAGPVGPFLSAFPIANYSDYFSPTTVTAAINLTFYVTGMTYLVGFKIESACHVPIDSQRRLFSAVDTVFPLVNLAMAWLLWPTAPVKPGDSVSLLIDFRLWRKADGRPKLVVHDTNFSLISSDALKKSLVKSEQLTITSSPRPSRNRKKPTARSEIPLVERSLCEQLRSPQFIFLLAFLSFFALSQTFYIGNADNQLLPKTSWMATLVLIQENLTPVVLMPPIAWLLQREGYGYAAGVVVTAIGGVLMYIPLLFPGHGTAGNVVTTCFLSLMMTALWTFLFTYIAATFGYNNFGKIVGITFLLTGGIEQLNFVLNNFANSVGFEIPNAIFAGISCLFIPLGLSKRGRNLISPPRENFTIDSDASKV